MCNVVLGVLKQHKVPILIENVYFFQNKNRKLLEIEISIWAISNRLVSYCRLVKDVLQV